MEKVSWPNDGRCRSSDYRLFFTSDKLSEEVAGKLAGVCAACPVLEECRRYVAEHRPRAGFWAGEQLYDAREVKANDPDIPVLCETRLVLCGPTHLREFDVAREQCEDVGVFVCTPGKVADAPHAVRVVLTRESELASAEGMVGAAGYVIVTDNPDSRDAEKMFRDRYVAGELPAAMRAVKDLAEEVML